MALVDIDSLTPGMKVGRDVVEASGQILLGAGTEITEKHLRVFRSWGVQSVDIEGPKPPDSDDSLLARASPAALAQAQSAVAARFRHTNADHPAVIELMRLAVLAELRANTPAPPV